MDEEDTVGQGVHVLFRLVIITNEASSKNVANTIRRMHAWASRHAKAATQSKLKFNDFWIALLRLTALVIIFVGISFGAKQTYLSIGVSHVLGAELDADLKLALLGFLNKSLDIILVSSLEYTASMMLTIWMISGGRSKGATFSDFGLKDELTKPWMTLVSFYTRYRQSQWSWRSLARCLFCLCISVSVLLQGLAINTIAVPKARWFPNYNSSWKVTARSREIMTVIHPKTALQAIDWYNLLGVGQANVGIEGYPPWDWALGLSASLSFTGLAHIVSTLNRPEKNWQHVYRWILDGDSRKRWTALNTAFDYHDLTVETISADDEQIWDLFEWLRRMAHEPSSSSTGWVGNLTIVLPALNTLCKPTNQSAQKEQFAVTVPGDNRSGTPTFSIRLASVPSRNFTGATCYSTFRQALFPVNLWIVDLQGVDLSYNGYGNDWDKHIVYEPTMAADYKIVQALAIQTQDSIPRLQALTQTASLLEHFLFVSSQLRKVDTSIPSDTDALSIVVGVLLQNLLSISNKYWSSLPATTILQTSEKVSSYPLQWQVYGSGPRLAWEWLAVMVLLLVLASLLFGLYQSLRYRMGPGSWVELGGMMMLAQTSPPLQDIDNEDEAQKRLYRVEDSVQDKKILRS
jgi:hypothetical protein